MKHQIAGFWTSFEKRGLLAVVLRMNWITPSVWKRGVALVSWITAVAVYYFARNIPPEFSNRFGRRTPISQQFRRSPLARHFFAKRCRQSWLRAPLQRILSGQEITGVSESGSHCAELPQPGFRPDSSSRSRGRYPRIYG